MKHIQAARWAVAALLAAGCVAPGEDPGSPSAEPAVAGDAAAQPWGVWLEDLACDDLRPSLAAARTLASAERLECVLDLLDEVALDHPREPAVFAARAGAYFAMGFPRAAEHQLELALVLAPECEHLWRELALVRGRLGLRNQAEEALRNAQALASR